MIAIEIRRRAPICKRRLVMVPWIRRRYYRSKKQLI
jgi:hypothetical protein